MQRFLQHARNHLRVLWFAFAILATALGFLLMSEEFSRRSLLNDALVHREERLHDLAEAKLAYDSSTARAERMKALMIELLMRRQTPTPTYESLVDAALKTAQSDSIHLALAQALLQFSKREVMHLSQPNLRRLGLFLGVVLAFALFLVGITWVFKGSTPST